MANSNAAARVARHKRLRKKVSGTSERPRLAVFRSLKHIYAQVIDDSTGTTIVAASSQEKGMAGGNAEGAKKVGEALAKRAQSLLGEVRAKLDAAQAEQATAANTAGTQDNLA